MRILMLTIGYPPSHVGGTEIYVAGLVDELSRRGHTSEVAYVDEVPDGDAVAVRSTSRDGVRVHQILVPRSRFRLESVAFDEELTAAVVAVFRTLVRDRQPDVIHVHPLQLGLESHLMEALHGDGCNVVLTYHSSTTCCARGDLVRFGERACDGIMRPVECTECLMHFRGVPRPIASALARLPLSWYRAVHDSRPAASVGKLKSFASFPLLIEARQKNWRRAVASSDRIVAVCQWVAESCRTNGADPRQVVLCRHGHRFAAHPAGARTELPVRFGYVGRLSPEKGIDVLLDAARRVGRDVPFELEVVSATFAAPRPSPDERAVIDQLHMAARADARLKLIGSVPDAELTARIGTWDAAIVPSLWFESGPQVVYEAFAAGTPVIGSRRGGIAELVTHEETGFLFEAGHAGALAALLRRFSIEPEPLRALRSRIPQVRTTADVAHDMIRLYETVVEQHAAVG